MLSRPFDTQAWSILAEAQLRRPWPAGRRRRRPADAMRLALTA